MKITVEAFKKSYDENGGDMAKVMAATGLSRATFFRMKSSMLSTATALPPATAPTPPPVIAALPPTPPPAPVAAAPAPVTPPPAPAPKPAAMPKEAVIKRGADGVVDIKPLDGEFDLSHYVPKLDGDLADYAVRDSYFSKLTTYYNAARSVALVGEAGVGKTSIARYLAAKLGLPFLSVSCDVLLGFGELFGQVNITDGTSHFVPGLFLHFIQKPSVILIDEFTALDPAKSFKLHQLLGDKEVLVKEANRGAGAVYKVHPQCFIILAGNPPNSGRYNGTNKANVALIDRPDAVLEMTDLSDAELSAIIPAHAEKPKLMRYYREAREFIVKNNLRTTFSVRVAKRIVGALSLGLGVGDAITDGFLNGVKLTAGDTGYKVLRDLANTIWDLGDVKRDDGTDVNVK